MRFLHSVGHSVSKQTVLESELMVLKGLEFKLDAPNPLTYVEILLEVLGRISYLNTEQLTRQRFCEDNSVISTEQLY